MNELTFTMLYLVSYCFHTCAFVYGLKAWKEGAPCFEKSSILSLFKSRTERTFITICIGTNANLLFLFIMPLYIYIHGAWSTGNLEIVWATFHILSGVSTFLWHYNSHHDIKGGYLDE